MDSVRCDRGHMAGPLETVKVCWWIVIWGEAEARGKKSRMVPVF